MNDLNGTMASIDKLTRWSDIQKECIKDPEKCKKWNEGNQIVNVFNWLTIILRILWWYVELKPKFQFKLFSS